MCTLHSCSSCQRTLAWDISAAMPRVNSKLLTMQVSGGMFPLQPFTSLNQLSAPWRLRSSAAAVAAGIAIEQADEAEAAATEAAAKEAAAQAAAAAAAAVENVEVGAAVCTTTCSVSPFSGCCNMGIALQRLGPYLRFTVRSDM